MLNRPLIVGSKGNMGRRYATILKHLGVSFQGVDQDEKWPERDTYDSVLICTPTDLHVSDVLYAMTLKVPILCEKPLARNLDVVLRLCDYAEKCGTSLRMVNQYASLAPSDGDGLTSYDYWNHGKDGLAWDCISVVALANGRVELREESPLWECQVNGRRHYSSEMDMAYVHMIQGWLAGNVSGIPYIRDAHTRVAAYLEANG